MVEPPPSGRHSDGTQGLRRRQGFPAGEGGPPWRPASWADDVDRDLGPEGLMISGLYQVWRSAAGCTEACMHIAVDAAPPVLTVLF